MSTGHTFKQLSDSSVPSALHDALRPMDKHGCPVPPKLGLFTLLGVAVGAGVPQRTVPEEYWHAASGVQSRCLEAHVRCTCGRMSVLALGTELRKCDGCERWFFYAGPEVLVYNSPAPGVD